MSWSPLVQRWELARALRNLRTRRELESVKTSKALGWDPSKLARIESARFRMINVRDVRDLLDYYDRPEDGQPVDAETRERILRLAEQSRKRGWWESDEYAGVFSGPLADLEAGASLIKIYELVVIPGLFQTPDYAHAVIAGGDVVDGHDVARRVAARMARQQEVLQRENPPEVWAVIDELAFMKPIGGAGVMAEQLRQLIEISKQPNVNLLVIPNDRGAHAALSIPFQMMGGYEASETAAVYVDLPGAPVVLEKADELDHYGSIYRRLLAVAEGPEDSVERMDRLATTLTQGEER